MHTQKVIITYHIWTDFPNNPNSRARLVVRFRGLEDSADDWGISESLPVTGSPEIVAGQLQNLARMITAKAAADQKRREEAATPVLPGIEPAPQFKSSLIPGENPNQTSGPALFSPPTC